MIAVVDKREGTEIIIDEKELIGDNNTYSRAKKVYGNLLFSELFFFSIYHIIFSYELVN